MVTEVQLRTVVVDEDSIRNRVAVDSVTPIHKSPIQEKRATNTDGGHIAKTESTPDYVAKEPKRGEKGKLVKE